MPDNLTKSPRTTLAAIIGAVMILLTQAQAFLDSNPDTNPQLDTIIAALAVLGIGVVAKDHKAGD